MNLNLLENPLDSHLEVIEWFQLEMKIKSYFHFESNKKASFLSKKVNDPEIIMNNLARLDHYYKILKEDRDSSLSSLTEFPSSEKAISLMREINRRSILDVHDLNLIILFLEISLKIKKYINDYISLNEKILVKIIKQFRMLVSRNGDLDEEGHPEIKEINKRIKQAESFIRQTLLSLSRDPLYRDALQFEGIDRIDNHYVLAIRSDHYQSSLGRIIGKSETTQTYYVEPFQIHDSVFQLWKIEAEKNQFILKFCQKISHSLSETQIPFNEIADEILLLDYDLGRAKFSKSHKFNAPQLVEKKSISFKNVFHPLLIDPVANSIELQQDKKGLIISGPNTGGKTILIKSIALSYLLLNEGMSLPCEAAKVSPINSLYYLGSDLQDLSVGLSSFSSELMSYQTLSESSLDNSIIIIDEIFNSTASEEASVISFALIQKLTSNYNALVILTTHHKRLKELFTSTPHFLHAHMSFNARTFKPSYQLVLGTPGSSMALEIAQQYAHNNPFLRSVLLDAKNFLEDSELEFEKRLHSLNIMDQNLKDFKRQLDLREKEISQKENFIEMQTQHAKTKIINNFKHKIRETIARIDMEIDNKMNRKQLVKERAALTTLLERPDQKSKRNEIELTPIKFASLKVGDQCYESELGLIVKILSIRDSQRIIVQAGILKKEVPIQNLFNRQAAQAQNIKPSFISTQKAEHSIDVRGFSVNELEDQIDRSLTHLLQGHLPYLEIIHGHGASILKNWVRRELPKMYDDIEVIKPENRDDGITIIKLKP